ncbi:glycosyltransferase family 4 protein [Thiobacillus sp.]|uniref:glycosyltransferase family 4 protein n=1 Tax=Thiobacillus sp. TaxID=924 RepID=UPI00286DCFCE|nr:glycosyltransferase family 4 protein [Thiobacillus sp.]
MTAPRIKLFYAVPEYFPPWRLDVRHLFAEQLPKLGVDVTWSMWRDKPGACTSSTWLGQRVILPLSAGRSGRLARIMSRLTHSLCEIPLFFRMMFGERYDIVQVRDLRYATAFLGWMVARVRGAKFIYWLSYPFPEHYLEKSRSGSGLSCIANWLQGSLSFYFVYKWLMHRADHVFVQSDQMMRDVSAYGVPVSKMSPVPMGVPPALLDWLAENPTGVVPGRIVYVGTMASIRRLETLIEAFARVVAQRPDATLVMVGEGDLPSERAFLEQEAKRLGVSAQVVFTGFIPMEEAWRYAASAQVCVSPFFPTFVLRSTSPTKLNEYFALERPVVANDHPEQSAAIKESGSGLCVSWGAENFSDAMLWALNNPLEAEEMAEKGASWVRKNRTYDRISVDVLARYQGLMGRTAGAWK